MSYCGFLRRLKQKNTIFVLAQSFSKKWNQSSTVQRGYDSTSSKTLGTSPAVSGALPRISENLLKVSKNNMIINKHFINDTEGRKGKGRELQLLPAASGQGLWNTVQSTGLFCSLNNKVSGVYLSCLVLTLLALDAEEKIVFQRENSLLTAGNKGTVCCMWQVI